MKAYEIVKHLVEGGSIKSDYGRTSPSTLKNIRQVVGHPCMSDILDFPDRFELIKDKKIIKQFSYTYKTNGSDDNTCISSLWTSLSWDSYKKEQLMNNRVLRHTENRELEIDD